MSLDEVIQEELTSRKAGHPTGLIALSTDELERIAACVNAMADVDDPAGLVEAVKKITAERLLTDPLLDLFSDAWVKIESDRARAANQMLTSSPTGATS